MVWSQQICHEALLTPLVLGLVPNDRSDVEAMSACPCWAAARISLVLLLMAGYCHHRPLPSGWEPPPLFGIHPDGTRGHHYVSRLSALQRKRCEKSASQASQSFTNSLLPMNSDVGIPKCASWVRKQPRIEGTTMTMNSTIWGIMAVIDRLRHQTLRTYQLSTSGNRSR